MFSLTVFVLILLTNSQLSWAKTGQKYSSPSKIAVKIEMSPEVSEELKGQMRAIQATVQSTVEMVSKGQWQKLEEQGKEIEQLVLAPLRYKNALPAPFLNYAKALKDAGTDLKKAAKAKHGGSVLANYYRILSTCMKCHADFAPNYFEHDKEFTPPQDMPQKYYKSPDDWH